MPRADLMDWLLVVLGVAMIGVVLTAGWWALGWGR